MGNKSFTVRPFEKLKKKIASRDPILSSPPVLPKKKDHYTDAELFCTAMGDVQVIEEFKVLSLVPRRKKIAPSRGKTGPEREALTILSEITEGLRPINLPDTQEYVEWTNPECRDDVIQKLHKGEFSIQEYLDLHGFTVREAEQELETFFQDSFKKGLRCVKIIHGRGLRSTRGARLKEAVVKRLSGHYRKNIIAYVSARQCDGGLGALYILLKNK